jgi:hypothetical protein
MTPQEKAKEIFNKMKGFRVKHSHSKKCALIAVDEILQSIDWHEFETPNVEIDFWQEVKNELLKMKL